MKPVDSMIRKGRIDAARGAWNHIPAKERAHLLGYMREEAATFAKGEMFGDEDEPVWARANLAAVALLVAVAGEPRPRTKAPKRKARR